MIRLKGSLEKCDGIQWIRLAQDRNDTVFDERGKILGIYWLSKVIVASQKLYPMELDDFSEVGL
jgi:hypothetical protein